MKNTQLTMWVNPDCRSVGPAMLWHTKLYGLRNVWRQGLSRTQAVPWRGTLFSFCSIKTDSAGTGGAVVLWFLRTRHRLTHSR